jgi:hypothetical protein
MAAIRAAADGPQQGAIAVRCLSDPDFKLPPKVRQAMQAVVNQTIDPSQDTTIMVMALHEGRLPDAVASQCGQSLDALVTAAKAAKPEERAKLVSDACKLEGRVDAAGLARANYASLLLSVALEKLLAADPEHSEGELEVARTVARHARSTP